MTTSGTYAFSLSTGEVILAALERCQIVGERVTVDMLNSGQRELNLWFASISNDGPNLWTVDLVTQTLVAGTATYNVDPSTVMILDMYMEVGSPPTSTIITGLSRSTYAALPDKTTQGRPTSFWFDRLIAPTFTMWPVPDSTLTYTIKYYRYRQIQDGGLASAQTPEVPYLFYDAMVAAIAMRLSRIYARPLYDSLKVDATEAWALATTQNTENARMTITPMLASYFR